ncbi:MAG: rod shape-determining protein MreD [Clostridium sp.]|nr:rod shape-determining protein MreD [Clostridium sp.]
MKRFLVYVLLVLLCFLLQTTVFQWFELAGIVPNILVIIVVSVGYMRGHNEAVLIGILCGLCVDLVYGNFIGFYAFIYMSVGYVSGYANFFYAADDFTLPIILIGIGDLLYSIVMYSLSFLLRARLHVFYYVRRIIIPELIYTVIVAIIFYKVIHSINQLLIRFETREE